MSYVGTYIMAKWLINCVSLFSHGTKVLPKYTIHKLVSYLALWVVNY